MDILSKKAKLLIGIIAAVYVAAFLYFGFWKAEHLTGDSRGYYIHLPSSLLYHDVGDYATSSAVLKGYNNDGDFREGLFVGPLGKRVVKYPVGVAILEAPFFALAHLYCFISGAPADGFSTPYMFFVGLSSSFYAIWGIWLLMLALQPYFKKEAVRLAVGLTIGLATNLFYASTYTVGMSHPCLFFLYALLLLGTIRFYAQPSTRGAIWVGAAAGMIALTRSPEIISVLIPLLWGLNRWFDFPKRIRFIQENARKFGLAAVAFVFMLLPQAFYWKFVTGHWWYNGYQGESFNWAHPKFWMGYSITRTVG